MDDAASATPATTTTPAGPAPDSHISHAAALEYWGGVEASVDGVLGGYPQISRADLRGSVAFIGKLKRSLRYSAAAAAAGIAADGGGLFARAVDCGAGIGRVTAGCLGKMAEVVDVVEPVERFAEEAAAALLRQQQQQQQQSSSASSPSSPLPPSSRVGRVYTVGLEDWTPDMEAYDLIWNQWCLGQLTDRELVRYLKRCKTGIKPHGFICVKENLNTAPDGLDSFDELDSSVTRSDASFNRIFQAAGLKVVMHEMQKGFPKELGLYPVKMYALRPA